MLRAEEKQVADVQKSFPLISWIFQWNPNLFHRAGYWIMQYK